MQDRFKKAVDQVGITVTVFDGNKTKEGNAVIYPVRNSSSGYDGRDNVYEGVSEPERYIMYCDDELAEYAEHSNTVKFQGDTYTILWVDRYSCKQGAYIKVYLKKNVSGE